MQILHVTGARSWGGNEQQLVVLIDELKKKHVENPVYGVQSSPVQQYCEANDIKFIASTAEKLSSRKNFRHFSSIVKDLKPDVIHLHTSDSLTLYVLGDLLYGIKAPVVFSKKGIGGSMSILSRYKYNYKGIDKIISVSGMVENYLRNEVLKAKNLNKLVVVHDAVNELVEEKEMPDLRELLNLDKDVFLIVNIANHTKAKDLSTLVKMADFLVHEMAVKDVHVVQIGQFSKLTEALQQEVKELGLEAFVSFMGYQDDASYFLPQADVFAISSSREGGPSSVLEAFKFKTPVISTKVGLVPEVIEDGKNGFVVDVGDFQEMAKKIASLKAEKQLREEFGAASHQIFKNNFTSQKMAEETLKIYNGLIKN